MNADVYAFGSKISQSIVGFRELGFGQDFGEKVFDGSFLVPTDLIGKVMGAQYNEFVAANRDDVIDSESGELERMGYPPFSEVLKDDRLLCEAFTECLHFDFLEKVAVSKDAVVVVIKIENAHVLQNKVKVDVKMVLAQHSDDETLAWLRRAIWSGGPVAPE